MNYPKPVWEQLKATSDDEIVKALRKDGWMQDSTRGAVQVYRHPDGRRVTVHPHPNKTYRPKLLKALLDQIGWTEQDLRRLKLIR